MRELLKARLRAAGVAAEAEQVEKLAAFHALLTGANARMNLTRVSADPAEAIDRNYLDSLSPLPHLAGAKTCVDVGSGAGFPGVPLAIAVPEARITLLDSLQKRVNWLKTVLPQLEVPADCVAARAEEYVAGHREQFDLVTSRAVARLNVLAELCLPYVRVGGRFLALKGAMAQEEADEANHAVAALGGKLAGIREYPVDDAVHRIVVVEKVRPTPAAYPRKFAKIKQNPL